MERLRKELRIKRRGRGGIFKDAVRTIERESNAEHAEIAEESKEIERAVLIFQRSSKSKS